MIPIRTLVAALVASGVPVIGSAQGTNTSGTSEPTHVTLIGADYAFVQLPATLPAGPTLFAFENRGTRRHEMSIALLRPGVVIDSLLAGADGPAVSSRAVADSIVGVLLARPGERSGGQLYANLMSGRTYVVICTVRDTPSAPQHSTLGMVGTFLVR
jgi:hypothetical protein